MFSKFQTYETQKNQKKGKEVSNILPWFFSKQKERREFEVFMTELYTFNNIVFTSNIELKSVNLVCSI